MLDILRRIVQEVSSAASLEEALNLIVLRVKGEMKVDVCSIYLTDQRAKQMVLMATDGLNLGAVGQVRMGMREGLVSMVAEREEPLNLRKPYNHPRFMEFPETGEERYHSFLGVPIIHHRRNMGVLVLQHHSKKRFGEDVVTFLVTIAAQLAGVIAHAEVSGEIDGLRANNGTSGSQLTGLPGAPGVAIGVATVIAPYADIDAIPDRKITDTSAEIVRFREAVEAVKGEIRDMAELIGVSLSKEDSALFEAYLLMLDSDSLTDETEEAIRQGNWAQGALRDTLKRHIRLFENMQDAYLRERSEDVRDLGRRVLGRLENSRRDKPDYPMQTVLISEEISATMLAEVPQDRLAGVISVCGSRTSHVAILARSFGVPAVMGVEDLPVNRINGKDIIADGYSGKVLVNPSEPIRSEYLRLQREEMAMSERLLALRDEPAVTKDGFQVHLYANTGLIADISPSLQCGAEGIGLYRTEFPFLIRDRFPGEEEQRQIYRTALEAFAPSPVVMRTLDVGGDKALSYFPINESNPFLGWRGIRITLDHPEIFLSQLRAMIRANVGLENLQLLLPMITDVSEVDEALRLIHRAHDEILEEGEEAVMPKVGVMIEVPSAIYLAEELARRVDFFSVGSNDLTQYLLAVDRNNQRVANLYDSLHPSVLRALMVLVKGARKHNRPVSVCGEMAGDPVAALLLMGMGIDSLSVTASSLLRIKWVIRTFSRKRASAALERVLKMESADDIRQHLNSLMDKAGLGGLVRAGD